MELPNEIKTIITEHLVNLLKYLSDYIPENFIGIEWNKVHLL